MKFHETSIDGLRRMTLDAHADARGLFVEGFSAWWFEVAGQEFQVRMTNLALSDEKGTVRGLHWQDPPRAQGKIVFAMTGRVWDAVVDLRPGSKTLGLYYGLELVPFENALFIPRGFAHGWQALESRGSILYLLDNDYSPAHERGVRFDSVPWPLPAARVSDRDRAWPTLDEVLGKPAAHAGPGAGER